MSVLLIGAGKRKLDHPAPARDLYVGSMFRARLGYAERGAQRWFVLSPKYGLLDPDEEIEPYDCAMIRQSIAYRRAWAERVADRLDAPAVDLHAGAAYAEPLAAALRARGRTVSTPLRGLGQGQQMAWYRADAAEALTDAG